MLLYHGTNERAGKEALTYGLQPRQETGVPGNWSHTVQSRPDCVYLTSVYAAYFAAMATSDSDDRWCIIEVDVDRIDDTLLLPDEDYMEQATVRSDIPDDEFFEGLREASRIEDGHERMIIRTNWFRENLEYFSDRWRDSVNGIGNCCLQDDIPPEAITRVAYYDSDSNPSISITSVDPFISLMNYHLFRPKYEALTQWFMGDEYNTDTLLGPAVTLLDEKHLQRARDGLLMRDGLEIIRLRQPYAVGREEIQPVL